MMAYEKDTLGKKSEKADEKIWKKWSTFCKDYVRKDPTKYKKLRRKK